MPRSASNNNNKAEGAPCTWPGCKTYVSRKADLPRHLRTHSDNKKDYCWGCPWPGCEHRTLQRSNIMTHLLTHTQEKVHVCPEPGCGFRCVDPASISRHKRNLEHGRGLATVVKSNTRPVPAHLQPIPPAIIASRPYTRSDLPKKAPKQSRFTASSSSSTASSSSSIPPITSYTSVFSASEPLSPTTSSTSASSTYTFSASAPSSPAPASKETFLAPQTFDQSQSQSYFPPSEITHGWIPAGQLTTAVLQGYESAPEIKDRFLWSCESIYGPNYASALARCNNPRAMNPAWLVPVLGYELGSQWPDNRNEQYRGFDLPFERWYDEWRFSMIPALAQQQPQQQQPQFVFPGFDFDTPSPASLSPSSTLASSPPSYHTQSEEKLDFIDWNSFDFSSLLLSQDGLGVDSFIPFDPLSPLSIPDMGSPFTDSVYTASSPLSDFSI